jgi:hypothetical protein
LHFHEKALRGSFAESAGHAGLEDMSVCDLKPMEAFNHEDTSA